MGGVFNLKSVEFDRIIIIIITEKNNSKSLQICVEFRKKGMNNWGQRRSVAQGRRRKNDTVPVEREEVGLVGLFN